MSHMREHCVRDHLIFFNVEINLLNYILWRVQRELYVVIILYKIYLQLYVYCALIFFYFILILGSDSVSIIKCVSMSIFCSDFIYH